MPLLPGKIINSGVNFYNDAIQGFRFGVYFFSIFRTSNVTSRSVLGFSELRQFCVAYSAESMRLYKGSEILEILRTNNIPGAESRKFLHTAFQSSGAF